MEVVVVGERDEGVGGLAFGGLGTSSWVYVISSGF